LIQVHDTIRTILETGDVVGHDNNGHTILQLKLDEIQLEELAMFGSYFEDLEQERFEYDDAM
jgi:hypothetical protein